MITLFLKDTDIPELTAFSGNIDADSLKPHIYIAQTTDIKRVLGVDLYNKIYSDFVADTLADDYLLIFNEYVVDMLVYFSCAYYMGFGAYKTSNAGVYKTNADGASLADVKEVNVLISRYRQLGSSVENSFYEFMKTNTTISEYVHEEKKTTNIVNWY